MFNIRKHLRHVVLAMGLAAASLTAGASVLPTYHISVADTATADVASIDFLFSSIVGAVPVKATLSNFTGATLSELDRQCDVSGTPDGFAIGNFAGCNYLYLAVSGPFAFDLNFSEDFIGADPTFASNSDFSIALYTSDNKLIGDETIGTLDFALSETGVVTTSTSSVVSVAEVTAAEVPEPTDWVLMLTGLAFVVYMTRQNGRAHARKIAQA
jgi:hypothetical protein